MVWGIKCILNDDLWQWFVDVIVEQVCVFGVMLFDFGFMWNEVCGYYDFLLFDWFEFKCVFDGYGFCNCECFVICKYVYEEGEWVCEVVFVYVCKQVECVVVN